MIIRNSAKCHSCNTEIESKHRHDFVYCKCGDISVDGGRDYLKRSAKDGAKYTDTSVEESCFDNGARAERTLITQWIFDNFICKEPTGRDKAGAIFDGIKECAHREVLKCKP